MRNGKTVVLCLLATLLLYGCSDGGTSVILPTETSSSESAAVLPTSADGETLVTLNNQSITIDKAGTYRLSGSIQNGQVCVDAGKDDEVILIFDGVSLSCDGSAALYVKSADKVTIDLEKGSENTVTSVGTFSKINDNIDAAVFSKEDLKIKGSGKLTISSVGNGITSKDDLKLKNGEMTVSATGHAIEAKDSIEIEGGSYLLTSGKDAIHAENNDDTSLGSVLISGGNFTIAASEDAVSAGTTLDISGGEFTIVTGDGCPDTVAEKNNGFFGNLFKSASSAEQSTSQKGLKSDGNMTISNGAFVIDANDDAIHAGGDIIISGGLFQIASGDDAIHSDMNVTVDDGKISISNSYEGIEGLNVTVNGGEISLVSTDDGINAAGGNDNSGFGGRGQDKFGSSSSSSAITVNGGIIHINARGDGVDANGNLYVDGGELYVSGPTDNGNGALDYDGTGKITGGIVIAAGSTGMAQTFNSKESTQPSCIVNLSGNAGDTILICDSNGKQLASFTADKGFQCVAVSLPDFKVGESYTISAGKNQTSFTLSSIVNNAGGHGGMRQR